MAYTASTGFRFFRSLSGNKPNPAPIRFLIDDSTTIAIGDLIRINSSGLAVRSGSTSPVLGVAVGLVDNNGINVLGQGYGTASGATLSGDDTVTTASDNSSRATAVYVMVDPDPSGDLLWLNDANADLAQTNLLQFMDSTSSNQADQASASDTSGQLQLVLLDPEATGGKTADASKGAFRIAERQLMGQIGNSTAVIAA